MKVLFITTFGQSIPHEHIFTRNVWLKMCQYPEVNLLTIYKGADNESKSEWLTYDKAEHWYQLTIPSHIFKSHISTVDFIERYLRQISPDIIHSNMIEGFEIEAAKRLNIPVVMTMHIGGLICPRGGGNGFLKWDDSLCNGNVGTECRKCCCHELPLPYIARAIDYIMPKKLINRLKNITRHRKIFYLSPLLSINDTIAERLRIIEILKYATVITANSRLSEMLSFLGIPTVVIPHGIRHFNHIQYPTIDSDSVIKFYYLGRIQYSKGLHILLKAFKGIPHNLYELHVFGDAYQPRREQRYKKKILHLAKDINVNFHGFVENSNLNSLLKDMHVMIHPAIFHEVYGINISEALSLGHPVLATQCGGPEMQIREGINGWLVPPNSPYALRNAINKIIDQRDRLSTMSANCSCPNTLEHYVEELMSLYRKITKADEKNTGNSQRTIS